MIEGKFLPRPVGTWGHGSSRGFFGTSMAAKGMAATSQSLDDIQGRLKDLDKEGIDIQVVYPNIMAMASHLDDDDLAAAMSRVYNNYCAEKMSSLRRPGQSHRCCSTSETRRSTKELRHAIKDLGLVGTVVTGTVGQRNLDDPYFEPFFREANAEKAERLC